MVGFAMRGTAPLVRWFSIDSSKGGFNGVVVRNVSFWAGSRKIKQNLPFIFLQAFAGFCELDLVT